MHGVYGLAAPQCRWRLSEGAVKGQFTYQDFDLLIEPSAGGGYRARVLRSPAGESAPVQFTLPFSAMELENFVLKVGLVRSRTRGPGRPESAPLKDFGAKLYGAVFQDELRETLLRSLSLTGGPGAGLRLRLRLSDAPELADVPWEFLYDRRLNRFLAQSRRTPLVRYLDLPDPPHPLAVEGPLRLLVMISSPTGYPPLNTEQERRLLTGALAEQQEEGRVIVEQLAANMGTLRRRLRREQFHVFHFVGHGHYRSDWGDGVLVMEDRNGQPHEVTGEELGGLLNEYDPTRLAVLNACEGARSSAHDPFAGVAQSLIQQGLPAVVAMQFAITDNAAIIFAQELYAAIADGYPLEAALAEARRAIRDEGNPTEWGTPVLYSRAPDGHLFDLTGRAGTYDAELRKADKETARAAAEAAEYPAQEWAESRKADEETAAEYSAPEEAEIRLAEEETAAAATAEAGRPAAGAPSPHSVSLEPQAIRLQLRSRRRIDTHVVNATFTWRLDDPVDRARPVLSGELAGDITAGGKVSGHAFLHLVETSSILWDRARAMLFGGDSRYQADSMTLAIDGVGVFRAARKQITQNRLPSDNGRWWLEASDPALTEFLARAARLAEEELRRRP